MTLKIQNFIVGLLFFIASTIIVLTFVFDFYSPEGYNVNLSTNPDTAFLSEVQAKAITAQSDASSTTDGIWNKTIGQNDSNYGSGEVSEGDMIKSSLRALGNIGNFLDVFITMLSASFNAIGLHPKGIIFWFFITATIISVGLLLLSTVLRNWT